MGADVNNIPRKRKLEIAQAIRNNLAERAAKGPPEPGLDHFIGEFDVVLGALAAPIAEHTTADAVRTARLVQLDEEDDGGDTYTRLVESFVYIQGHRRSGSHVASSRALHNAAFPDGLAHIDDPIPAQNQVSRDALAVLRAPEWASTLAAIELPTVWLDRWESHVGKSESLYKEIERARTVKKVAIGAGQDAELDCVESLVRLRRYVGSRARKADKERQAEGRTLLAPLLDELAKVKALAASRATLREKAGKGASTTPAAAPQVVAAPATNKPSA
jgi:hypothetical protein